MKTIIYKLPYKVRERWRGVAYDMQETHGQRPKFKDLVSFVSTQAKMALHPLFGDLKEGSRTQYTHTAAEKKGKSVFTTVTMPKNPLECSSSTKGPSSPNDAFMNPCLFCNRNHCMAECKMMRRALKKDKIDFLFNKGLCFSCLRTGHMSRQCENKLKCELCSSVHPTVLHTKDTAPIL